jgi:hypothetical protein
VNVVFARRSGSFVRFFLDGELPVGDGWVKGFERDRFKGIEDASSEEESIGWVSPGDPTGKGFDAADCWVQEAVAVRIRVDRKRVPAKWMWIHMTVELAGRDRMTAREKRDLREEVSRRILPRVLPVVSWIDVLIVPKKREALVFGASGKSVEVFRGLMLRTFELRAAAAEPRELALRMGLSAERLQYLEECSPTTFSEPVVSGTREASA